MASNSLLAVISLFLTLTIGGCGQTPGSPSADSPYDSPSIYFLTVQNIAVEVAYEPGAEPYTGTGLGDKGLLWDFTQQNLNAVFDGRAQHVSISVPKDLSAMSTIPQQTKNLWNANDLQNLGTANRKRYSTAATGQLFVMFLNGYYDDGSTNGPNTNVIGARVDGTSIIAIFKPVITLSAVTESMDVARYIEQSTLTHELGHALGLVDLGIPLTSAHEDKSHPGHCTNPNCAMYYLNDGVQNLNTFVKQFLQTGNLVIFGSECLQDTHLYHP